MSNSTLLQQLITAASLLHNPFKSVQTSSEALAIDIGIARMQLNELNQQAGRIDGYRLTQTSLQQTGVQLGQAQTHAQTLAVAFKQMKAPTAEQKVGLDDARASVIQLKQQHNDLILSLQRQRQVLKAAGVDTNSLAESDKQLRGSISQTTSHLKQQQKALARVQSQKQREQTRVSVKQKVASVAETFQARQALASKASGVGAAGLKGASTLFNTAVKLLKPGFEASERRSAETTSSDSTQPASRVQKNVPAVAAPANNLGGDLDKLSATWQQLSVDIFASQEGSLRSLVQTATEMLGKLDSWVQKNGDLMQSLGTVAAIATGVMGVVGAIGYVAGPVITGINMIVAAAGLIAPIFETIGLVIGGLSLPVLGVVAVIAGAALLIRRYWEPLSAFFSGVFAGISESFAPLFDVIGKVFQSAVEWLDKISTPIASTQEGLESCRNAGVMFGHLLTDAFMLPLKGLEKLSSGVGWVLEQLGLVDKKSAALPDVMQKKSSADSYIPDTSEIPAYNGSLYNYTPVSSGNSQSFSDNRVNHINITMQGGNTSAMDVASTVKSELSQVNDNSQIQRLASFSR